MRVICLFVLLLASSLVAAPAPLPRSRSGPQQVVYHSPEFSTTYVFVLRPDGQYRSWLKPEYVQPNFNPMWYGQWRIVPDRNRLDRVFLEIRETCVPQHHAEQNYNLTHYIDVKNVRRYR